MDNTMRKRLAALASAMLLANVFLPTGIAFAEESAPVAVVAQAESQETETSLTAEASTPANEEVQESSEASNQAQETQVSEETASSDTSVQVAEEEKASTQEQAQVSEEVQEQKVEKTETSTGATEIFEQTGSAVETTGALVNSGQEEKGAQQSAPQEAQTAGYSAFRKIPAGYESFIPAELKGKVDAFYGSNNPTPYVLGIMSDDGATIDLSATKSHSFYTQLLGGLKTNIANLGDHKIFEIAGYKVLFQQKDNKVYVNEYGSTIKNAFKGGTDDRSQILWKVDLSKAIAPYGNITSFKKVGDSGYKANTDKYNEIKKDGKLIGYTIKTDDFRWIYAPLLKTETFYTSNGNGFEVIVDNDGKVDIAKNKEVVEKKYPGNQDLIDAVKGIQKAEILEIDNKKVLFAQMQGGETKAFVSEKDSNLKDAFKTQGAQDMTVLLVPDLTQSVKASWVDTTKKIKKYHEIKSGTTTIGYTFHNEANDWFFAPAVLKETKAFYTSNDVEFKVVMKNSTTVDVDMTKLLFASVIPTLSAELQALAASATDSNVEIKNIEGVDILFVNLGSSTKAFFAQKSSIFQNAFKGGENMNEAVVYENPVGAHWVDTTKPVKKYNEVKQGSTVIGYTLKNEANQWFYAKKKSFTTTNFYTSDNVEFPVVLNAAGTAVDVVGTKAVLLPLIPTITNPTLKAEAEDFAQHATGSDVEIKEIEGVKLLFVKVGNGMKTFAGTQSSIFQNAFKGGTNGTPSYDPAKIVKAAWVDSSKPIVVYNEVKKNGTVIGYTLKNNANQWFYATKKATSSSSGSGGSGSGGSGSGGSGSGGGSSSSATTGAQSAPVANFVERVYSGQVTSPLCSLEGSNFSEEQNQTYLWACGKDITTIRAISGARLDQPLTRAELAKMMSVYVTKVLGKQPALSGSVQYADVDEKLGDLAGYIQLAYQLQIMGIKHDGTALDRFEPNKLVTRAEFATVFSRVLYGDKYNQAGENWAQGHLDALKAAGILKDTTPHMQEIRGRVLLMLHRSTANK